MGNLLHRAYRRWADHSTSTGILARRMRRLLNRLAHGGHRRGNIVMLHAGRCGSSVLADMLGLHPDVHWANEPFEGMKPAYLGMDSSRRAEQVIGDRMYLQRSKYFGFDVKYLPEQHLRPELANLSPGDFITLLERLGFEFFVLLSRRNHLRRAMSVIMGYRTGRWNSFDPVASPAKIRLDPHRFRSYDREMSLLDYFSELEKTHAAFQRRLQPHVTLELNYEDDVQEDPQIGYRKLCAYVGVAPGDVPVRLHRMNPKPLKQMIENFDEVADVLHGTSYEWMLDG